MKYNFSFDRKHLFVLMGGLLFIGFLTFAGGIVTGIRLWTPTQTEIALLKSTNSAATTVAAAAPTPPKLPAVAAPKVPAMPAPAVTLASLSRPAANAQAPSAASPAAAAPQAAEPPAVAESTGPSAPAPASSTEAAPEPSPVVRTAARAKNAFCLQLGSFEKQENAKKLQSDLKDKGYAAIIFEQIDSEQRTWHAVRIGGYDSLDSASKAAADFSSKERIQALVRKSDAL